MTRHMLTIYGRLDALNDYIGANRTNRQAGAKMKRENEAMVTGYIWQQLKNEIIEKPVYITFVWYEPNKRRDPDNISSFGRKIILDALVAAGVLQNDGWKQIAGFRDVFNVDKARPRVVVIMEEID